jgi:hypothetical protein
VPKRIGGLPAVRVNYENNEKIMPSRPKLWHLPTWGAAQEPQRMGVLRDIVRQYGRDPRVHDLASEIIRRSGVPPRDYKGQAAVLLKWIQNPQNVYYINEPGERLQSPTYTLRVKRGDCDDMAILLAAMLESVAIEWRFVLSGRDRQGRLRRWVEGQPRIPGGRWTHIYLAALIPTRPGQRKQLVFMEPTLPKPLGWDVIQASRAGGGSILPELAGAEDEDFDWRKELVRSLHPGRIAIAALTGTLIALLSTEIKSVISK